MPRMHTCLQVPCDRLAQGVYSMDENTITLTVNGKEISGAKGQTVLEVFRDNGIHIPTLCYHPKMPPYGGCRLCIVEIEKMRGLVPACTTPAANGMVVQTHTEQVVRELEKPCQDQHDDRKTYESISQTLLGEELAVRWFLFPFYHGLDNVDRFLYITFHGHDGAPSFDVMIYKVEDTGEGEDRGGSHVYLEL